MSNSRRRSPASARARRDDGRRAVRRTEGDHRELRRPPAAARAPSTPASTKSARRCCCRRGRSIPAGPRTATTRPTPAGSSPTAESTLAQTAVLNVAPNGTGSGYASAGPAIWMSGGGPAADAAGNVYLLTANGAFETTLDANGFPSQGDYGNSFLKLATERRRAHGGGLLHHVQRGERVDRRRGSRLRRRPAAAGPDRLRRHGAPSHGRRRQGRQSLRRQS